MVCLCKSLKAVVYDGAIAELNKHGEKIRRSGVSGNVGAGNSGEGTCKLVQRGVTQSVQRKLLNIL